MNTKEKFQAAESYMDMICEIARCVPGSDRENNLIDACAVAYQERPWFVWADVEVERRKQRTRPWIEQ